MNKYINKDMQEANMQVLESQHKHSKWNQIKAFVSNGIFSFQYFKNKS